MTGCAPQGYEAVSTIASQTVQNIACKDAALEENLWDGLKTYLIEQKTLLSVEDLQQALDTEIEKLAHNNPQLTQQETHRLSSDLRQLVVSLLGEAPQGERVTTSEQLLILLSALDVGDRSTVFRSYMQSKVRQQFQSLQKTVQSFDLNCPAPENSSSEPSAAPVVEQNKDFEFHKAQALAQGDNLSVFGGRWAFATAYQSCQSVQLPSMTSQTPDISGISIVGKHPDGVGSKRMIANLAQLQSTHYYIRDMSTYPNSCVNVRQNPLIYDYGGKPYATTAADSPIDFFKNNGDGTSVLGVDCSGYVFTSLATAGLRLKAGRALKASDSWAWGSSSYVEPQDNGLTCLSKISVTPTQSLKAGDVVAVYGHVLLIDKVGVDPFGINSAKSESDCAKITSNQFDFVVAQSAPSKNGIGINYFVARDYLPTSAKMKAGLEKYASYACLAKVNGKTYVPNVGTLSVVRHKGTPECLAPRVKLAREECIQTCSSLSR